MSDLTKFEFDGVQLDAVTGDDGKMWFPLKPFCVALGVDLESQRKKLKASHWSVAVMNTVTAADGKSYRTFCVDRRTLIMWHATIDASRVSDEARPRVERFQSGIADVLEALATGKSIRANTPFETRVLLESHKDWKLMFEKSFAKEIMRLQGKKWTSGNYFPGGDVGQVIKNIYECILGTEAYREMKSKNPNPRHGSNHHQLITEQADPVFRRDLSLAYAFARMSFDMVDFTARMNMHFRGAGIQRCLPLAMMPVQGPLKEVSTERTPKPKNAIKKISVEFDFEAAAAKTKKKKDES